MKHSLAHLQDLIPTLAGTPANTFFLLFIAIPTSFFKFKIFAYILFVYFL